MKAWQGLGWNPIQSGDCYKHRSRILESRNDGHEIYIKCVPMQWPLDNEPGECEFESWITLDGPAVRVHNRLVNHRTTTPNIPPARRSCPPCTATARGTS